jgi:hypothetical protein
MINSIYFICCPIGSPEKTGYEHQIISIAEGLKDIGIKFYSNINYWREKVSNNSFLLKHDSSINFRDCDVVVFSSNFISIKGERALPNGLFNKDRRYKLVFIDQADGLHTPGFNLYNRVDFVLKSHFNYKYNYPLNFKSWQFGLTNRVINSTIPAITAIRKHDILINFRVSHNIREEAKKRVFPLICKYLVSNESTEPFEEDESDIDQLYWHQTGRRHYSSYYKRLTESIACACFGGYFEKSIPFQNNKLGYYLRHLDYKFNLFRFNKAYQFDSWRFWESLAAGCCTVHIDLERYGAVFPVMPINGVHYLGVDFDNIALIEEDLAKGVNFLQRIGEEGRKWVLCNYSPKATANRFIDIVNDI